MKRICLAAVILLSFLSSCTDDKQEVSLLETSLETSPNGGSFSVVVSANCEWQIDNSSPTSWLSASTGKNLLNILVAANDTYSERSASITIRSIDQSSFASLTVTQSENKGILVTGNPHIVLKGEACEFSIDIESNVSDLSVTVPNWIEYKGARSLTASTLWFAAAENDTRAQREGKIVLSGDGEKTEYYIKQDVKEVLAERIRIEQGEYILIGTEDKYRLDVVFYPEYCTDTELEWTSDNESTVKVDGDGWLTVHDNGIATVTAVNPKSGAKASIEVEVKIKATHMEFAYLDGSSYYNARLGLGEKVNVRIKTLPENAYKGDIVVSSTNRSVAGYDEGTLFASDSNQGESIITAIDSYSGLETQLDVTVRKYYTRGGHNVFHQYEDHVEMSFAGIIQTNHPHAIKVLGAFLVDEDGYAFAEVRDYEYYGENMVKIVSPTINITEKFGITILNDREIPIRFYVTFAYDDEVLSDFIQINSKSSVSW